MGKEQKMREIEDLTNLKFGKLLVVGTESVLTKKGLRVFHKCLCECGNIKLAYTRDLKKSVITSCGICHKFEDITGKRFGRVLVLSLFIEKGKYNRWNCLCDCGKEFVTSGISLVKRTTRSCGCLASDTVKEWHSKPFDEVFLNSKYMQYKRRAEGKQISFDITIDYFKELTSRNCYYCNHDPDAHKIKKNGENLTVYSNGMDRVDNLMGYTSDNVVPCCKKCNYAKNIYTLEEFLCLVKDIYENLELNKT